jgi:hypothetical protein
MELVFYGMMKQIGEEMHQSTRALAISETGSPLPSTCVWNLTFSYNDFKNSRAAGTLGFTLPISKGGHKVFLPKKILM